MYLKNCKSCQKEIYFLITKHRKRIPVDADSLSDEEKEILDSGRELAFVYNQHISHFATCPNAKDFRKEK